MAAEHDYMKLALRLARRGYGTTSPNPMVGAVLVKNGRIIGRGWHHRAGQPHAEIEAFHDAKKRGHTTNGATLYVTLEPCSTHGRTPPCSEAIVAAGIKKVVVGATDPNPRHRGKGFRTLKRNVPQVTHGLMADECTRINEAFNHWIVHRTPFVTVKAAMTLDGKIATATGESKWITGERARAQGMQLREGADAILVGIQTVLADDPNLTFRAADGQAIVSPHRLRRIVLDSNARIPLHARLISDSHAALTTIVVSRTAPKNRVAPLAKRVTVLIAPGRKGRIDLRWLLKKLGAENVTNLLVEGGGEVNASFLLEKLAHRVVFFYAPKVLGGSASLRGVGGDGARGWPEILRLADPVWRKLGPDLMLTARVTS